MHARHRENFVKPVHLGKPVSLASRLYDVIEKVIKPPRRISPLQTAQEFLKIANDHTVGLYDPSVTPYASKPLEAMATDSGFRTVVFVGPAQVGKTQMFFSYFLYCLLIDPADIFLVEKSQGDARDFSMTKFSSDFLEANAELMNPLFKPGKSAKSTFTKFFENGVIFRVGWPSRNQVAGKTLPRIFWADADRPKSDTDGEGDFYSLLDKRRQTFGPRGKLVVESSPSKLPKTFKIHNPQTPHEAPHYPGILSLYNRGTMDRWLFRCENDECDRFFEANLETMKWPGKDGSDEVVMTNMQRAAASYLECPHCTTRYPAIVDGNKNFWKDRFNARARWFSSGIIIDGLPTGSIYNDSDIASFWLKGPAARFSNWAEITKKYLDAYDEYERTGNDNTLKSVVNTDWGEAWVPIKSASDITIEGLKARAAGPDRGIVPSWVRYIIITVDVQRYSFELQAHGFGPNNEMCFIDRWSIKQSNRIVRDDTGHGTPERARLEPGIFQEDFDVLIDEAINREFPLEGGIGTMKPIIVACDSGGSSKGNTIGGGVTSNILNFWRSLARRGNGLNLRFLPLKGEPKKDAIETDLKFPDSTGRKDRNSGSAGDVPMLFIGSTKMKDLSYVSLMRLDRGTGYVHIPSWAPDAWYLELTAEEKQGELWVKVRSKNESWDNYTYAKAVNMCELIMGDQIDWEHPAKAWALPWHQNPYVSGYSPENGGIGVEKEQSDEQLRLERQRRRQEIAAKMNS